MNPSDAFELIEAWRTLVRAFFRSSSVPDFQAITALFEKEGIAIPTSDVYERICFIHAELCKSFVNHASPTESFSLGTPFRRAELLSGFEYDRISALQNELPRSLGAHSDAALLHGSFGTNDFIRGWSDLDLIVFLTDKAFENPAALKSVQQTLRKWSFICYQIDPLTHHEFIVITPIERMQYSHGFFPASLFSYGKRLWGNETINLTLASQGISPQKVFIREVEMFQERVTQQAYARNAFEWKNDLSHMLLFPSLLLEAHGETVYKRESFARARTIFPHYDWKVIDQASRIRTKWRNHLWLQKVPVTIPAPLRSLLVRLARKSQPLVTSKNDVVQMTDSFLCMLRVAKDDMLS